MKSLMTLALTLILGSGCSLQENSQDKRNQLNQPRLVNSENLKKVGDQPIQSNLIGSRNLTLYLNQIASENYYATHLPNCYDSFAASDVLGVVTCSTDAELKIELKAAHVNQVCTFDGDAGVERTESIDASGCKGTLQISVFEFSPSLRLKVLDK